MTITVRNYETATYLTATFPAFLPTSLHPCLPLILLPCHLACLSSYLPASLPAFHPTTLPSCLPLFLPSCLLACLSVTLPTAVPTSLPPCLPLFLFPHSPVAVLLEFMRCKPVAESSTGSRSRGAGVGDRQQLFHSVQLFTNSNVFKFLILYPLSFSCFNLFNAILAQAKQNICAPRF